MYDAEYALEVALRIDNVRTLVLYERTTSWEIYDVLSSTPNVACKYDY